MISPQLPLEAAMLEQDGFGIGAMQAHTLIYLSLADGKKAASFKPIENGAALGAEALAGLKSYVAAFDDPATPYLSHSKMFKLRTEGEYDHLARVREWSASGEEP